MTRTSALPARFVFIALTIMAMNTTCILAQTEPEAPPSVLRPEPTKNGWQISFYAGVSLNDYYEGYDIVNAIDFLADESSWNVPFGGALNIPVFDDLSLYLRAGVQSMNTNFFNGKIDSLTSLPKTGEMGYSMDFAFDIFHVDLLMRLIGNNEGERVYFGPSFGFVNKKHITLTRTEFESGYSEILQDQDMPGADDMFPTFIVGAEYAFVPVKNLYVIPALEVNFGWEKISDQQRLRATYYRFLVNVSYQVF